MVKEPIIKAFIWLLCLAAAVGLALVFSGIEQWIFDIDTIW